MSVPRIRCPFVARFIRKMRGGSQPILAQASDGHLYVVKFNNNLQGVNLPFNESMGTELYRACGLPVPPWKPLLVSDAFLDKNPDCWIETPEGTLRPTSGVCFGSCFLGGHGIQLLEILPGSFFPRIQNRKDFWLAWLVDICAGHSDNRQAIFTEIASGRFNAVFLDHGHLFGGPKGDQNPACRASRYLDARAYDDSTADLMLTLSGFADKLSVRGLWDQAQALPSEWKVDSAVRNLAMCLDRLSNPRFIRVSLELMSNSRCQTSAREQLFSKYGGTRSVPFLRLGVQSARVPGNAFA
jgi:hypothetical protein